jgi:hypothetical protein
MPTTVPVKDMHSGELPTVPIPVCMGPPTDLLIKTIRTDEDVRSDTRLEVPFVSHCLVSR